MYAYGKKSPEWLRTAPILSHFDTKDKNRAYRDMVQGYSREEKRLWEDFRHSLFWDHRSLLTVSSPNICPKNPMLKFPKNGRF